MELVSQGAEARIYQCMFLGEKCIVKERFCKTYRHPTLDRSLRTKQFSTELKAITKCSRVGLRVSTILWADVPNCRLFLRFIVGSTIKDWLTEQQNVFDSDACKALAKTLGQTIAKIHHDAQLVHGDLTTSNFMVDANMNVFVLDFGLTYYNGDEEDFAVDLYVLERAMLSTHPKSEELFGRILKAYRKAFPGGVAVVKRLNLVRQRGRKKIAFG